MELRYRSAQARYGGRRPVQKAVVVARRSAKDRVMMHANMRAKRRVIKRVMLMPAFYLEHYSIYFICDLFLL